MAEVSDFLEPEEYKKERSVTVQGIVTELRQEKIETYTYNYPVVSVENIHLWTDTSGYDSYPYYSDYSYPYPRYPYYLYPHSHYH